MTVPATKRGKAIFYAEDMRETHILWLAHLRLNTTPGDVVNLVGGEQHHLGCVAKYDIILEVLRND